MKAIVYTKYGPPDILELKDVDTPTIDDDGILVRVRAVSLNPLDWRVMSGKPVFLRLMFGLFKPKRNVPGVDMAGQVEAVGKNVTLFKAGDEVFAHRHGACAEYISGKEKNFVAKPLNLTMEEAATIPVAGLSALQSLRDKGQLKPGQKVLINGASGGVGTFAVQIAKGMGATVTGVCSTKNVDLVRSLGADHVVDYTEEDFTKSQSRYDLIIDNQANHSLAELRRILSPEGIVVTVGAPHKISVLSLIFQMLKAAVVSRLGKQKFLSFLANPTKEDLLALKELIEGGKVKPVIDRTYPLAETTDALRFLEQGHARGKVIVTL